MLSILYYTAAFVTLYPILTISISFTNGATKLPSKTTSSNGRKAKCEVGMIQVSAQAQNVNLRYDGPANQTILTQTFNEVLAAGSTIGTKVQGGPSMIRDTYGIYAKLCFPPDPKPENLKIVQLLTHGGSLNSQYWDLDENSYVDAAAAAGYATLSYDRLGAGKSQRPDPVQIVQAPMEVEIGHVLTQALRDGSIDGIHKFDRVISTSHSSGSILTIGQSVKYPEDFDALIITGFTINANYVPHTIAAGAYELASSRYRFKNLANGYYLQATSQVIQFLFFQFPNYSKKMFDTFVKNKDTQTIGELFTLGSVVAQNPQFTGPVDVVVGEADFIFCGSDCHVPNDHSAEVQPALYPNAAKGSQSYLVPNSGHNINAHYSAGQAYQQMLKFLSDNELAPQTGAKTVKQEL